MRSDTAMIRAVHALFLNYGVEKWSTIEYLEQFEEWLQQLSDLELSALIEFLSRRLTRRFEAVKQQSK